jgi:hypothetical protein
MYLSEKELILLELVASKEAHGGVRMEWFGNRQEVGDMLLKFQKDDLVAAEPLVVFEDGGSVFKGKLTDEGRRVIEIAKLQREARGVVPPRPGDKLADQLSEHGRRSLKDVFVAGTRPLPPSPPSVSPLTPPPSGMSPAQPYGVVHDMQVGDDLRVAQPSSKTPIKTTTVDQARTPPQPQFTDAETRFILAAFDQSNESATFKIDDVRKALEIDDAEAKDLMAILSRKGALSAATFGSGKFTPDVRQWVREQLRAGVGMQPKYWTPAQRRFLEAANRIGDGDRFRFGAIMKAANVAAQTVNVLAAQLNNRGMLEMTADREALVFTRQALDVVRKEFGAHDEDEDKVTPEEFNRP